MDHGPWSMVADTFHWVFSEPLLTACGTEATCCRRQRIITPFRLGLALTATCASQPVETLADFHRGFNAVWGPTITYKAFSNQVAKSHFADFARPMASRLIGDMTLKVLGFAKGRAFAECRHLVLQDGSAFLPSLMACARCCPDASQWSSPRLLHSIPPWLCSAMPPPPWS
jgi:hypothetical protein